MSEALLLKLHLFAIAFWFGVVGVEFVLEQSRANSRSHGLAVARYHASIDLYLEMPAFLVAAFTGLALVNFDQIQGWYAVKVVAGLVAVLGNMYCLYPVLKRKQAALNENLTEVIFWSKRIDQISVFAIPAGVLALVLAVLF